MDAPEDDDFRDLRRALERLARQLYEATHTLSRLSTQLKTTLGSSYHEHGAPFGSSRTAERIWNRYKQYTTAN
jgi:hypothetical protein